MLKIRSFVNEYCKKTLFRSVINHEVLARNPRFFGVGYNKVACI